MMMMMMMMMMMSQTVRGQRCNITSMIVMHYLEEKKIEYGFLNASPYTLCRAYIVRELTNIRIRNKLFSRFEDKQL